MLKNSDILIWGLLIFTVIIIVGLYMSQQTPINIQSSDIPKFIDYSKIMEMNKNIEHFSNPSTSSQNDVENGASQKYNWEDNDFIPVSHHPDCTPHKGCHHE